ncbi:MULTISPECIES: tetratricopeptide repeat-containing sensor histidine kinase [unclassified Flavobacterium]|uniref:tetratricopeptide repeat-containing sensor histidine kinase n=1 Tax=unclassified Flavobacterium TaxID=196869 RepID=UPI000EB5A69B|nr:MULTISPECIES: tetratricopeptide repeat-containing sensor histidine kinase [unclassified Flavobacterium]RKS00964.1 signal transduction histidine kinase [Flavobacterium sp. 102]
MNKRAVFLLILLVIFIGCNSNLADKKTTATNDSIQKYLDLAGNDTLDFEKRIKYNDKALGFLDLERNDSLTREYLSKINYLYLKANNFKSFEKVIKLYSNKVFEKKDSLGIARYHKYKGHFYHLTKVKDSAFYNYSKADKIYQFMNNKYEIALINLNKSLIQNDINDYLGAELSAKKAYNYFKENKLYKHEFKSLVLIGNINQSIGENVLAIKCYKDAMFLIDKFDDKKNSCPKGSCLNNIGNVYREQNNFKAAIFYFKLALKEKNLFEKDPELLGFISNNLGYCYLKTNQLQIPTLFEKSKKIFDSLELKDESAICDINLSEYFSKKGNSLKANLHAESALKLAKESKASYYYLIALSHAGSINPKKAPIYIKEYHRINDSILFAERTSRNQYYKIQLETDEITQQKDTAVKHRTFVIIVAIFLLFISILVFIIARQRLKQKELRIKQTEQNTNEEIYQLMLTQESKEEEARQIEKKRIGLELHDGVMNKLVSTRLNLSILSISRDEATVKKCLDYIKDIQNIEKEIRNVAHNLNQEVFSGTNSFNKLLNSYIKDLNRASNTIFKIETDSYIDWNAISNSKKMNLYRIIQEASHNILKHAKAKNAIINIVKVGANINLSITDDGIGLNHSSSKNGIGLQNMKYRIKLLKGKFKISSKTNSGTTINITIPKRD